MHVCSKAHYLNNIITNAKPVWAKLQYYHIFYLINFPFAYFIILLTFAFS